MRRLCVSIIKSLLFTILVSLCFSFINNAYAIVYIDKDSTSGANDGTSWPDAYTTIQAAISGETDADVEFWVAEGTYSPSSTLTPSQGAQFYGGFDGAEIDRDQRNIDDHPTIINGNSSRRIFYVEQTGIRIDGFTLTNGNGSTSGKAYSNEGGAIFIYQVPAEIANCTFTNNTSTIMGGAISVRWETHTTTIDNCVFQNNSSVRYGGAICGFESDVSISNSSFDSNSVSGWNPTSGGPLGGAIYISRNTTPDISDCTFTENTSSHAGGAIMLNNPTSASVTDCEFYTNSAEAGGALSGQWDASSAKPSVSIENCLFQNNFSTSEGGAVFSWYCHMDILNSQFLGNYSLYGGAIKLDYKLIDPDIADTIDKCLFLGNYTTLDASDVGGAIQSFARSMEVTNSVFAFNYAPNGGAVALHSGKNEDDPFGQSAYDPNYYATFKNCTFSENRAREVLGDPYDGWGGAIFGSSVPSVYLYNCIFWSNHADTSQWNVGPPGFFEETSDLFFSDVTTNLSLRYTDIETLNYQYGLVNIVDDTGSFSSDPLFVDPNGDDDTEGTLDDNFQLSGSSPCLDRADGANVSEQDIVLTSRVDLKSVPNLGEGEPDYADIGAYEATLTSIPMAPIYMLLLENTE